MTGTTLGLDLGGTNWTSVDGEGIVLDGDTAPYGSLEELLTANFAARGSLKTGYDKMALALPGVPDRDGKVEFVNIDWPAVSPDKISHEFGGKVVFINDMQAAVIGAANVDHRKLIPLKRGTSDQERYISVLTLSTGVNWTTGERDGSKPMRREQGHTQLMVRRMGDHQPYAVEQMSEADKRPTSIEDLLSGRGVERLTDHYYGGVYGHDTTVPFAVAMTQGVMAGDYNWQLAANKYANVLSQVIYQIVVGEVVGDLYIQGSVLMGTPGFAEWLFNESPLMEELTSMSMEMDSLAEEVTIWGVPKNLHMPAHGAQKLAETL